MDPVCPPAFPLIVAQFCKPLKDLQTRPAISIKAHPIVLEAIPRDTHSRR